MKTKKMGNNRLCYTSWKCTGVDRSGFHPEPEREQITGTQENWLDQPTSACRPPPYEA